MKILLPYGKFKIDDPVMIGGIENFTKKIYEEYEDVFLVDLTLLESEYESKQLIDKSNELIKKSAFKYDVDIIINNWHSARYAGAGMMDCSVPILHIEHTNNKVMSCLSFFKRLIDNNHSIFLVNPFQKNYYDAFAERINLPPLNFSGYVEPMFLSGEKPKVEENPEFDCVTIGRCDPVGKAPFRLKTMLKDTNFKTLVMTNLYGPTTNNKYYENNKHWEDCLYNTPHNEVMKNLSNAKTYFMTWEDETFGITGLEALGRGLPLILNSRMTEDRKPTKKQNSKYPLHATNIIPVKDTHCVNIMLSSSEELIDAINKLKNIDRQEVQDMTWEKYTKKRWKNILDNAIDNTIENFKSNKAGCLPI